MYFSRAWIDEKVAAIPDKREKARELIYFITSANDYLNKECAELAEELRQISIEIGYEEGEVAALFYQAFGRLLQDKSERNLQPYLELEKRIAAMPQSEVTSLMLQMYAFFYWGTGQRDKAFEIAYRIFRNQETVDSVWFAWANYMFGVFYFDLKDYDVSLSYFRKAEEMGVKYDEKYGMARIQAGIGGIHLARGEFSEAMRYTKAAMEGFREVGHKTAESRALNDLGVLHLRLGNRNEAEKFLREALSIRRQMEYLPGLITTEMQLAELLLNDGSTDEAEAFLVSALEKSTLLRSKIKIAQGHRLLSELYKKKNDPAKALVHFEKFYEVKTDVEGEESTNRLKHLQQKHATEKSEHEAEIHRLRNVELKKAYEEIGEKNKSIVDSIHYARRIQRALLASQDMLEKNLPEFFVLYKPKDIVSGDFYWASASGSKFFLAACDCTGHGVPGAFMSLLNSAYLNEAVVEKQLRNPALILDDVRTRLIHTLNPEGTKEQARDGMDATLLALDHDSLTLEFACANNALWLVRDGELSVFGPDKFPVGVPPGTEAKPFTLHRLLLQKNDCIYIYTDGFADQFGGPMGKKFKLRQLKQQLVNIHQLPMQEQRDKLDRIHEEWRGNLEQVDDILLMGIRF